jgi:NitT/TauT family transport system permease protein
VRFGRAGGAAIGCAALLALWGALYRAYGFLVLPSPLATLQSLEGLVQSGAVLPAVLATAANALGGFALGSSIGAALGLVAGAVPALGEVLAPIVTIILGVPPIAWVVLSLLWFGTGWLSPLFTVVVTAVPVLFAAALQGIRSSDRDLAEMAAAYRIPRAALLADVTVPHLLSYLFPALATALGFAWRVEVMAEVMGAGTGIGAGLSLARANLDTAEALAWVVVAVALVLAAEGLMLDPLRRVAERWRQ